MHVAHQLASSLQIPSDTMLTFYWQVSDIQDKVKLLFVFSQQNISGSPPLPPSPPPLPLFSRCPFTNQVLKLDDPFFVIQIISRLRSGVCKRLKDVSRCTRCHCLLGISTDPVSQYGLPICLFFLSRANVWYLTSSTSNWFFYAFPTPGDLGHRSTRPLPLLLAASHH